MLGFHHYSNAVKTILEEDDLKRMKTTYKIPDSIVLEVPSLSSKVTSSQYGRLALYVESLKASLRLQILDIFAELLRWYSSTLPNSSPLLGG